MCVLCSQHTQGLKKEHGQLLGSLCSRPSACFPLILF